MMIEVLCRLWDRIHSGKQPHSRGCRSCGHCCDLYGGYLHASDADLKRWRQLGRDDLLALVNEMGWIWIDPKKRRRGDPCPFLQRISPDEARCAIHAIKPDMCRDYPSLDHGRHCVRGIYIPRQTSPKDPTLH